jgi:adenine-specific DNA-methyltransferase
MAEKLEMMSRDIIKENIDYIASKFPNALKEVMENGKLVKRIDFDVLKQELSNVVIDDKQERYQMTWPDKKKSILLANSRINGTLRPVKEKSVDFDNTQNLYIEGDNLDVLKLLRETYLGKVKMIYIDPPYNTGNDFVYEDDFSQTSEEYLENSGQFDQQGNKLFQNTDSNGRFHTDWLNMMYPRLKIAKDLLADDGLIFMSIDDNELNNLSKLCDEIFGRKHFVCVFIWEKTTNPNSTFNNVGITHEYILCYSKSITKLNLLELDESDIASYTGHDDYENERGPYKLVGLNKTGTVTDLRPNLMFDIIAPDGSTIKPKPRWRWSKEKFEKGVKEDRIVFNKTKGQWTVYYKQYLLEDTEGNKVERGQLIKSIFNDCGTTTTGTLEINSLIGRGEFDFPKPTKLIAKLISIATSKNDIILDFFSGSATTAQAVLQKNLEDSGERRFIMVQLPEYVNSTNYDTICDIGEERIRKSGNKIKEESGVLGQNLDIGFRVLKLDSSNMNDVYYNPNSITQDLLETTVDNIKVDRTPLDLLFQVMLELGIELSAKIEEKELLGKKYFVVNENDIVACFDDGINDELVKELAKIKSIYAVFKDSAFTTDSANINCEQIFKSISPSTTIKVI